MHGLQRLILHPQQGPPMKWHRTMASAGRKRASQRSSQTRANQHKSSRYLALERLEDRSLPSITGMVFEDFNDNGVFDVTNTTPNASGVGTVGQAVDLGVPGV